LKGGKSTPPANDKPAPAKGRKTKKRVEGQREMLFPIEGKKAAAKETKREPAKRPARTRAANKTPATKRKAG
jgi:DNA end-binding protein Ku